MNWTDLAISSAPTAAISASQIVHGPSVPPQQRLLAYSPDQWEDFVQEWGHYCLKNAYIKVERYSGAGDMGIDVVGFVDEQRLLGAWDNFQCKHYDHPLRPSDVWAEFGKILWYSFKGNYKRPRHYYFVSPRGVGTKLSRLLGNAKLLRTELIANWDKSVKSFITETQDVPLDEALQKYLDAFDFTIFGAKTGLQLVEDHRDTPAFAARFGGGLPPRPIADKPPAALGSDESRYVTELLGAYSEHTKTVVLVPSDLTQPRLKDHFRRQREAFYEAEALRVFARDKVPPGTFESLQDNICDGVIDTHDSSHTDGFAKVLAVTKAARDLQITANALINSTNPKDRDGICHQLVNEERLQWTQQ